MSFIFWLSQFFQHCIGQVFSSQLALKPPVHWVVVKYRAPASNYCSRLVAALLYKDIMLKHMFMHNLCTFPFRINMYTCLLISRLFSNVHDLIRVYMFIRFWLLNLNSVIIHFLCSLFYYPYLPFKKDWICLVKIFTSWQLIFVLRFVV